MQTIKQQAIICFCSFFYSGFLPKFPGTWGSFFAGIVAFFVLLFSDAYILLFLSIILTLLSLWIIPFYTRDMPDSDPKEIVIDEVIGLFLSVFFVSFYFSSPWVILLVAFILFRFFDITKIFPINFADKNIKGAFGIILDDVLASFYSFFVVIIFFFFSSS